MTERPLNAIDLTRSWQAQGEPTRVKFSPDEQNLGQAEERVISHLKKELTKINQ